MYSTTSILPSQNAEVIERCLQSCPGLYVVDEVTSSDGQMDLPTSFLPAEKQSHGCICLPRSNGHGPVFFCVLSKRENGNDDSDRDDQ